MGSHFIEENIVREIEGRRVDVLQKFSDFEQKASEKRRLLVQSGQLQRFLRTATEFRQAIDSLIETAESVSIRHNSENLARAQKILNRLRGDVDGKRSNVTSLERESARLVDDGHYAAEEIQKTLSEIHSRWEYLLKLLELKWIQVQKELESMDFARKCESVLSWIQKTKTVEKPAQKQQFDDIRKYSIVWNEISAVYEQMSDPSPLDTENYEKVGSAWNDFQQHVNSMLRELDAHDRIQRFLENAEDVKGWMEEKETEIREKYSKMDVEESMRYRKTIEIEIKSTEQRVRSLREPRELQENPKLQEHVEQVEERFRVFQKFIHKWQVDLENAADLDSFVREAEDIRFWCSEKTEDLKVMKESESVDCDEIAMWIETNHFDFNSWDGAVKLFIKSGETILKKLTSSEDLRKVREEVENVQKAYEAAKRASDRTNEILEVRIKTINVEKLVFQTHQKAAHLVSVLQKSVAEDIKSEDVEKELRMLDGVAVRCISVVEQIEHIEQQMRGQPEQHGRLSENASEQINQLSDMKEILKTSTAERKRELQHRLDTAYFVDSCREIRMHTDQVLKQLKDGRAKKESVQPIREQMDELKQKMEGMDLREEDRKVAEEELERGRENLKRIEKEHERMTGMSEARKVVKRTEKFVERVHKWIEKSQIDDDETDSPLQNQHLRRVITSCRHLLSTSDTYKEAIEEKRNELSSADSPSSNDEPNCLLDGIQHALEEFAAKIRQKAAETEKILESAERMTELNSHNDWIKAKIKSLSTEPVWDSLLSAQKMSRRYEKDSEEIEARRKHINDLLKEKSASGPRLPIQEEIEHNWSKMKTMFDERGGILERMIRLFEYDEESTNTSEWLREKMIYADAIEPKDDESINRVQAKKLEDLADDVENYKPKIVETHALLEDALVTPKSKDSVSPQVVKYKAALTRKQGEIESDYVALQRLIVKKLKELRHLIQDADVLREIADMEKWIEEEEAQLNRMLTANSEELPNRLDDVATNLQRRRANLTEIKCTGIQSADSAPFQTHKVDDAFSMLDVFSFELDRIRQRAHRGALLKTLTAEVEDVIDSIQTTVEKIEARPSIGGHRKSQQGISDLPNLDGDLETLRRRVIASLEKAKEVRAANAELAPQVYDLEERLEKEWTEVSRAAEERKKRAERGKLLSELDTELLDMEQWIDTFNEEVIVVTGGIHDGLGVQVGLESIDTWREELSHRVDQLGDSKNLLASVLNTISAMEERNAWLGRVADIESDLVKARKTIDAKQDELSEFSNILGAERDCERLHAWVNGKREQLETEASSENAKTVIRRMNEIEKMMTSRAGEVEQLREFLEELKASKKPSSFKSTELELKFERLDDEWQQLEDELRRREVDLNESMSQLLLDEQFDKIQQWIEERRETIHQDSDVGTKPEDIEKRQKKYEKMASEINEYRPIYEDYLSNENYDDEKVRIVRELWSSLIETTTIRQKSLAEEIQKQRLFDLLDDIEIWLTDAETEVHTAVNFTSLYSTSDAEKSSRRLKSIDEQAGEKDELLRRVRPNEETDQIIVKLRAGIDELKHLIKANCEDLDVWKSMQEVVKAIDDEICWFKELCVIVSSTDVGHDTSSLEVLRRKHQRLHLETDRRKQKVAKIVDKTTDLVSRRSRPSLYSKIDEIDEKVAQMTELIESNGQISEIRTHRLEKWADYFALIDELREKEHVLEKIVQLPKAGTPEAILADVERKREVLETIGEQMGALKKAGEQMSQDEVIRTKTAENAVDKLRQQWAKATEEMEERSHQLRESIQASKFAWKCDTAIQCIRDQEEKVANLVHQKKASSNFENAVYHSTMSFVESYTKETIEKLVETSRGLKDSSEAVRKLRVVEERLAELKRHLAMLAEKIGADGQKKGRIQSIQDEYTKCACELANWLEQAEEDVADIVCFQTKESSEESRRILNEILETLRSEKIEMLEELELLEVELAELNEDVNTFTWYSHKTLSQRMERLDQTITDRIRIVDGEIHRHGENEKICKEAAETLQMCKNVIVEAKKELEQLQHLKLDDQREKLIDLIDNVQSSGMIEQLEEWRSLMGSRYIFDNKYTAATPHGVLVDTCHTLELMSSMLRSVEQSMTERSSSGVTEKQLREFEMAFEYFDREKKGWLDYERFELCIKSQGYEFTIETATIETMTILDPTKSGRILKTDYMRWMVKNETTNILDDHSAIEEALKSLDARKLSDSMSRKEAEFFMRKIAKHTETFTEHIHLEYKDFVDSFY
ncbi:unnamed protein product [Caenorhabditis sp. 36 PRJEB53466]|nr:unnamed protein product [Caenorhabditis sp. 36 PRJEB53466]